MAFVLAAVLTVCGGVHAGFDISIRLDRETDFTSEQLLLLEDGLFRAERLWESIVIGHAHDPAPVTFPITVFAANSGLASASAGNRFTAGDHVLPREGSLWINPQQIEPVSDGFGVAPGVDFLDELLAHEIGHALGIGGLWELNGVYQRDSGQYTGAYGLAAYQAEFDRQAEFIPVELAGGRSAANLHWDQLFRSSPEEGNPADPWSLSPLTGILDARGRDLGQELMSPALDPDYGEPFLSNTTVQSLKDLGYLVIESFPILGDLDANGMIEAADADYLTDKILAQEETSYCDVNSDGVLNEADHRYWVKEIATTYLGDADFNRLFNTADLVLVLQAGEYEDAIAANSTWVEGDWNGDFEFDTADLVAALEDGGYELTVPPALAPVPEPSTWLAGLLSGLILMRFRRLR